MLSAYEYGVRRGRDRARRVPIDRDFEWLATQGDGSLASPSAEDVESFEQGMADGAEEVA